MSNIFLISDTHFFHQGVLHMEPVARPFSSVEEMNEALVDRWNSVVTKRDVVYHLGDVAFCSQEKLEILSRLRGIKKLILGNHDKFPNKVYEKYFTKVEAMKYFDNGILTHIPIHAQELAYRWKHNIHGHLHSKRVLIPNNEIDVRYINVSCEHNNLTPIAYEEL